MSRHRKGGTAPVWFRVFCYALACLMLGWLLFEVARWTATAGG